MDLLSVFPDKKNPPDQQELAEILGPSYSLWSRITDHVMKQDPGGKQEWFFEGLKYGWNFRIRDRRRAIIYFLPRPHHFKVGFVFGDKAVDSIMASNVDPWIKNTLSSAKKYGEGRTIRIDIREDHQLDDILTLIGIKMAN